MFSDAEKIIIQNNTKLHYLKLWDIMHKCLHCNLAFSKIQKIVSKKSYLINEPIRPPAGRIGFKIYAGQIRVNCALLFDLLQISIQLSLIINDMINIANRSLI